MSVKIDVAHLWTKQSNVLTQHLTTPTYNPWSSSETELSKLPSSYQSDQAFFCHWSQKCPVHECCHIVYLDWAGFKTCTGSSTLTCYVQAQSQYFVLLWGLESVIPTSCLLKHSIMKGFISTCFSCSHSNTQEHCMSLSQRKNNRDKRSPEIAIWGCGARFYSCAKVTVKRSIEAKHPIYCWCHVAFLEFLKE